MTPNGQITPTLEPRASDFIQEHQGELALEKVLDIVRQRFPEASGVHVWLMDDPDEDNHCWIVLHVQVPGKRPADWCLTQQRIGVEEISSAISLPYHPFSFALDVVPEEYALE